MSGSPGEVANSTKKWKKYTNVYYFFIEEIGLDTIVGNTHKCKTIVCLNMIY